MKKILNILFWLIIVTGVVFATGVIDKKHDRQMLQDIVINIHPETGDNFISEEDIYTLINEVYDTVLGQELANIDIEKLERKIGTNQYIQRSDVHATLDGTLEIDLILRKPIMRIINKNEKSCYIDEQGALMDIHHEKVVRVLIANGNISDPLKSSSVWLTIDGDESGEENELCQIYKLANYIHKDKFLHAMIEQIYFNRNGDIELIPKLGGHLIIFGGLENMESKFDKLEVFYKKGLRNMDWDKYRIINLKYKNQVVCSK